MEYSTDFVRELLPRPTRYIDFGRMGEGSEYFEYSFIYRHKGH
jgi:hypothetical protein